MPWADYTCPGCPGIIQNHRFDASLGAKESAPWCQVCEIQMVPIAAINLDLRGDGRASEKFTIHRLVPTKDGLKQVEEVVDSAHKARQIEQDSAQRYTDGEGEPLRFRALHQNPSNMLENSFGTSGTIGGRAYSSGEAPTKKMPVTHHGTEKPKVTLARGGGKTAL